MFDMNIILFGIYQFDAFVSMTKMHFPNIPCYALLFATCKLITDLRRQVKSTRFKKGVNISKNLKRSNI